MPTKSLSAQKCLIHERLRKKKREKISISTIKDLEIISWQRMTSEEYVAKYMVHVAKLTESYGVLLSKQSFDITVCGTRFAGNSFICLIHYSTCKTILQHGFKS